MSAELHFEPVSQQTLREKLILETLRLVPTLGLEGFSLRQAAKSLGVSHQAPYAHFKSKEALFDEVAEMGFRRLLALIEHRLEILTEPFDRMMALGRTSIAFYAANPGLYLIMYRFPSPEKEGGGAARLFAVFGRETAAVAKHHRLQPEDAQGFTLGAWSSVHGLSNLSASGIFARPDVQQVFPSDLDELCRILEGFFQSYLGRSR